MILEGPPITRIERLHPSRWPAYVCVAHQFGPTPPHIHVSQFAAYAVAEGDWMATDSAANVHLLRTIWERPKL